MPSDSIVEEVRKIRDALAARFGYDLRAIAADARKRERLGRPKALSKKRVHRKPAPR
jgi:hypothetical protein